MPIKAHDQLLRRKLDNQPKRTARPKPKVDVIPSDGRVPASVCGRARDNACVGVALKNLKSSLEGHVIKRVGQLAQAASDRRNKTAFLNLAAAGESSPPCGLTQLPPETEDRVRRHNDAVKSFGSLAKIVDFATFQGLLCGIRFPPKGGEGLRENMWTLNEGAFLMLWKLVCQVVRSSQDP